jgi:hypothetical protein
MKKVSKPGERRKRGATSATVWRANADNSFICDRPVLAAASHNRIYARDPSRTEQR